MMVLQLYWSQRQSEPGLGAAQKNLWFKELPEDEEERLQILTLTSTTKEAQLEVEVSTCGCFWWR